MHFRNIRKSKIKLHLDKLKIFYYFSDSLPVISGDILLPGPLSSTGEMTGGGPIGSVGDRSVLMDGPVVEGGSTISNLSIMSQPGSVEHLHSLSPMHNINTSQDDLNANSSLVE